jgi:hypothetical protein
MKFSVTGFSVVINDSTKNSSSIETDNFYIK